MEGTANAFEVVDVMGTEGRGGMRYCLSTTTIHMSPRPQIVKKKTYATDRPPPPPSSTACASSAASCPRPALGVSRLCRSLISWGPNIVPFLRLGEIALDVGEAGEYC